MKKTIKLTESDLNRLVKRILKEQNQQPTPEMGLNNKQSNKYTFPIDVILTDGALMFPKKIKIPRGTTIVWNNQTGQGSFKVGGAVITVSKQGNGEGTNDTVAITFKVNGKDYYMQWADSIFGKVYNKEYMDIADAIFNLFDSGM